MHRRRTGIVAIIGLVVLAGCASPPEQAAEVCTDVAQKVGALAEISGSDTRKQIVPLLDAQLAIARDARSRLGEITTDDGQRPGHEGLLARWDRTVETMQQYRDIWQDPGQGRVLRMGEDMVVAMRIAAQEGRYREARDVLRTAATEYGAGSCTTIPWRGVED